MLKITHWQVYNNTAKEKGGGLYSSSNNLTIVGSEVSLSRVIDTGSCKVKIAALIASRSKT